MRVKLTLLRPDSTVADVVVTTSATATIGEIAAAIAEADPARGATIDRTAPRTLHVHRSGQRDPEFLLPTKPVGEAHIGSGLTVSVLTLDPNRDWTRQRLTEVEATIVVISGPDQGRSFQLDTESSWVGRDDDCEIALDDPMVSKRHARVELEPGIVRFIDNNSANGLVVDGGQVARIELIPGARITIGGSELEIRALTQTAVTPQATSRAGDTLHFNRSPRVDVRFPGETLEAPQIPTDEPGQGFPWLVMMAPLLMGVVLYIFTQSILSVIFVALSPLLMVGNYFSTRSERKRKRKEQIARFRVELARLTEKLAALQEEERAVRLAEAPSLRELVDAGEQHDRLLWTRRPEHWSFLTLRLGIGRSRSRTEVEKRRAGDRAIEEFEHQLEEAITPYEQIDGVPLIDALHVAGGIGVAGDARAAIPYFRGLVVQTFVLHSPAEVVCAALVDPRLSAELDWVKWLPHSSSAQSPIDAAMLADNASSGGILLAALEEVVQSRLAATSVDDAGRRPPIDHDESIEGIAKSAGTETGESLETPRIPVIVVLVAGEPPVDRGRLIQLLERGADVGVMPLWVAPTVEELPAICRTFVEVDSDASGSATLGLVREGREVQPIRIEGIDVERATLLAKSLAPVVDSSSYSADDSDLPPMVPFLEIVGTDLARDPAAVIDRWTQNESITDRASAEPVPRRKPGKLRALVGQAGVDAMHLDLRTQGPHALVGGTTGSGKSEFLQAWVLGMAAEYSPDRVTFLFVDYKGGSAFADCVRLPHCVGLVTDLNTHLVRRALTSLKAEIHHREHLFNRKKAKDLLELERRGDPECPPALIIVIDEFAALAGEIPEFVDGVVDIAQRGRSLGIHLIMATQRPAGVIKDNLRANTNLRVALRMADESDSTDVIGIAFAARSDPALPGPRIAKNGPGRLTPFQSAYAGGWTSESRAAARVDIAELSFGQGAVWEPDAEADDAPRNVGPNDTARLVDTFTAASAVAGIPAPRKPWLDELAPVYDLALLRQRTDTELILGVSDNPGAQAQQPVYFRPDDDGNIAVYGTGGSGKTTVLRTLAVAAGITPRGGPVQVYGIDFAAGGLRMLETLPHVGAIVAGDDAERISRLFAMLRELVESRVNRYAEARASTITEYRQLASAPDEPRILLLVDGMATFRQEYEFTGTGGIFAAFQQLLSDGRQVGVNVAVSADRPGSIAPSIAASIQRKIALRLADDNDYALLEAPADVLSATSPAGRAVFDGLETQIAVLGGTPNVAAQAKAVEELADSMVAQGVVRAPAIERLADDIPLSSIADRVGGLLPLGVVDDTLEAIGIEPVGAFMISGPPVSGRTTLLLALAASLAARKTPGTTFSYIGSARSPLAGLKLWKNKATTPDAAAQLARELLPQVEVAATDRKRHVIIIESIADLLSTGADSELAPVIKAARRNDHFVIAESESSTWTQSWPLLMEVKSARRGFALQPDQMEGEMLFKTAFPRAKRSEFPPGRGWLVDAGKVRKVQAAYAD